MSKIEWCTRTWNPLIGCSRVSEGCRHCYAERFVHRGLAPQHRGLTIAGDGGKGPRWTGDVRLVEERLGEPLRWKKPARVFVNSLSDLFHESVAFEAIAAIFGVMAACPHLAFQVLTKRPERARKFFEWLSPAPPPSVAWMEPHPPLDKIACLADEALEPSVDRAVRAHAFAIGRGAKAWPLQNLWLGVSVEDQRTADARIPVLLDLPAALRFVSYEPALGPVDFTRIRISDSCHEDVLGDGEWKGEPGAPSGLDWIIVGGESGPGARPFDVAWARSAIAQCRSAKVACFVKQFGAMPIDSEIGFLGMVAGLTWPTGTKASGEFGAVPTRLALRNRKGADPLEWPEDLRVREMPEVRA